MAQPSVANYFNSKKRSAVEEEKLSNARKVLILDEDNLKPAVPTILESHNIGCQDGQNKIKMVPSIITPKKMKKVATPRSNKLKPAINQGNIRQFLKNSINKTNSGDLVESVLLQNKINSECCNTSVSNAAHSTENASVDPNSTILIQPHSSKTPCTVFKEVNNVTNSISSSIEEPTLTDIKQKLNRSSRLSELRASIARFQQCEKKLKIDKQKTQETKDALALKNFKMLELEINVSPQKVKSPEKPYLSPKKEIQGARKNLFGSASPVKDVPCTEVRQSLSLPYKYRCVAEIFRSIDTVCQILYNRKETITFKKLKLAVEEMLKRNLTEKHIAQIKHLYPDSFVLHREKLREFGMGSQTEQWELVIIPKLRQGEQLTSEVQLVRRRKLFNILIEKVKDYHQEFLTTLDPPMVIERSKITRWHPSFDIEQLPDIETAEIPPQPNEQKLTTGYEVLQKAREMFSCNTRMERALERLNESTQTVNIPKTPLEATSILKGIPKALLEKVRQRQAAKALESMTRSASKDKEVQLYSKLPEIARLTRNLFVAEKKSVLPLDLVIDKLCNSYRSFLNKNEMESYLRTIAKEIDGWLVIHEIRGDFFVKLSKSSDLSVIMNELQRLADMKDLQ